MSLTIAAAPMGARVGLSAARRGEQQVLLAVSPKAWRPPGLRQLLVGGSEWGSHTQIGLYETERLQLANPSNEVSRLLWDVLGASRREDGGLPSWDSSLLTPDTPYHRRSPVEELPSRDLEVETTNLLRLFERVDLLNTNADDLLGKSASSPLHQPLLYRRLLDEVRRQVETARPGYRDVSEMRTTIRGRVDSRSLASWNAGATSRLRCRYSELSISTPLLGCICAALEWIADGRGARSQLPGKFADVRLRHDAVTIRRVLADVVAQSPREALAVGRSIRLGRLDQTWSESLRLALLVLGQLEVVASAVGKSNADAVELSVATDKLWERIVSDGLHRSGFESVIQQANGLTSDPWVRSPQAFSKTYPDNVARRAHDVFIVDAKYKAPPRGGAPVRDDQYQMFAYSHLVRDLPRAVRAAVLVYPGEAPRAEWIRGRDEDSRQPVELFVVQIPFPMPAQIATSRAWSRYLDHVGARLAQELGVVERVVDELIA